MYYDYMRYINLRFTYYLLKDIFIEHTGTDSIRHRGTCPSPTFTNGRAQGHVPLPTFTNGWAQGHMPLPTFTNGRAQGTPWVERTANKKLTKLYRPSWKYSPKRLIVLVEPKSGGARKKISGIRAGRMPPHFQIRPGATNWALNNNYSEITRCNNYDAV